MELCINLETLTINDLDLFQKYIEATDDIKTTTKLQQNLLREILTKFSHEKPIPVPKLFVPETYEQVKGLCKFKESEQYYEEKFKMRLKIFRQIDIANFITMGYPQWAMYDIKTIQTYISDIKRVLLDKDHSRIKSSNLFVKFFFQHFDKIMTLNYTNV